MHNRKVTTKNKRPGEFFLLRGYPLKWLLVVLAIAAACSPEKEKEAAHRHGTTYTCPMHPQVVQDNPGSCPVCGMDLVPVTQQGNDREIKLSDRQVALANIRVAAAGYSPVGYSTFLTGELVANRELATTVSSRTAGRIEKLYVKTTGLRVEKGAPLYGIYSEELLTLQREYLLALEQYHTFQKEKRYAGFMEAARKKLLLYGMTEAQVDRLSNSRALSPRITFMAPAAGIVTEIMVAEGGYVAEGAPLYKLKDLSSLWVEAQLYPRERELVKTGDIVQVLVYGYENQAAEGEVVFLSPEYRTGSQVITLRAEIANPAGRYRPGMQARVALGSGKKQALVLPADAVIRSEDGAHVWVKTGERTFAPRIVKTGLETFNQVEILEGLQQGDSVAVSGAYLLYSELVLKKGAGPGHGEMHTGTSRHQANPAEGDTESRQAKAVADTFRQTFTGIFEPYFRLKNALVASDAQGAKAASIRMIEAIKATDGQLAEGKARLFWTEKSACIREMLLEINTAEDIPSQRATFAALSKSLYESVRFIGGMDIPLYYQYCPMAFNNKGAYWFSEEKEVRNPYFGDKMLKCGAVKEII